MVPVLSHGSSTLRITRNARSPGHHPHCPGELLRLLNKKQSRQDDGQKDDKISQE